MTKPFACVRYDGFRDQVLDPQDVVGVGHVLRNTSQYFVVDYAAFLPNGDAIIKADQQEGLVRLDQSTSELAFPEMLYPNDDPAWVRWVKDGQRTHWAHGLLNKLLLVDEFPEPAERPETKEDRANRWIAACRPRGNGWKDHRQTKFWHGVNRKTIRVLTWDHFAVPKEELA